MGLNGFYGLNGVYGLNGLYGLYGQKQFCSIGSRWTRALNEMILRVKSNTRRLTRLKFIRSRSLNPTLEAVIEVTDIRGASY